MGLNSASDAIDTLRGILHDSLVRSQELEDKLKTALDKIVEYEQFCDAFILGYVAVVSEKANVFALQGYVEDREWYQKLKDQDVSELLDFLPPEHTDDVVLWVENKIRALEKFLQPLGLPDYGPFIELFFNFVNKILHIPETTGDDPAEAYYEIVKATDDLRQLTDWSNADGGYPLALQIPGELGPLMAALPEVETEYPLALQTPGELGPLMAALPEAETEYLLSLQTPKDMESLLQDLEHLLDYIEHLDVDTISQLLLSIILKIIPANIQAYEAEIEAIIKPIVSEIKRINFSQPTERVVRDIVHRLAELSEHYAAGHDSFSTVNKVIQNVSAVVCYVVDHNLLTTIQIKKLKADEALIPDKPIKGKFPAYKKQGDPKPSHTQATILYADDDEGLIHFDQIIAYLLDQARARLSPDMGDFAQRLIDGDAFTEVSDIFEDLLLGLEHAATEAWEALQAVATAPAPVPLSRLVHTGFEQLKKIVDAVFGGINDLVKKLIGLVSKLAQLAVNMVLGIRVPTYPFIYVPGLMGLSNVNIPCYLVALPWETIRHFHHSNSGSI